MRSVSLAFDRFGSECLAAESAMLGGCVADLLRDAARHYVCQLGSGRMATRVPNFARGRSGACEIEVGLDLECEEFAALAMEAERQGLRMEQLLAHAALLYLADARSVTPALAALDR